MKIEQILVTGMTIEIKISVLFTATSDLFMTNNDIYQFYDISSCIRNSINKIRDILRQNLRYKNRRTRIKHCKNVRAARGVCEDRNKWAALLSAYSFQRKGAYDDIYMNQ